ncbi:MAG: hypothetical protein OHK0024_09560 [Thalassobaculales bacterium]
MQPDTERRALGILSDTVNQQLGQANLVAREVRRAYQTGKAVDMFTARAAFNALPGWQRRQIDEAAQERAAVTARTQRQVAQARDTARDWRQMESRAENRENTVVFPRLGRFARQLPEQE